MPKELSKTYFSSINTIAFFTYLFIAAKVYPFLFSSDSLNYVLYQNSSIDFINFSFNLDQLSAFFVCFIAIISAIVTIYFSSYAKEYAGKYSIDKLSFVTHIFSLSMMGVVLASHVFNFLFFWEMMSLSSYLLVIFDHRNKDKVSAGFIYFLMTHIATAFLLIAFLLIAGKADMSFSGLQDLSFVSPNIIALSFFMFLIGSGIKAGMVPFHFWLPLAHPAAPSHVSALMSALMVKTPIYLMIRVIFDFLGPQVYMGYSLLAFGLLSALLGIIYALKENDIKKLLAFSTIENVGIIYIALSISVIFYSLEKYSLASLALIAALFHILNHAIYKSALFMGAGSVAQATHTKDLNKLGGLIKSMPRTAIFFLIPTISIAALPLFNGFVSEWLIYQSLIQGIQVESNILPFVLTITLMLLAMVVGFAFIVFSKTFATAFLAKPRSLEAKQAKEVAKPMWMPIALLSIFCLHLGVNPEALNELWTNILKQWGLTFPEQLAFFSTAPDFLLEFQLTFPTKILVAFLTLILIILFSTIGMSKTKFRKAIPWTCGYELSEKAQYNSSSFSQPSLRLLNNFYKIHFKEFFLELYFKFYIFCKTIRDYINSGDLHSYLLYILIAIIGGFSYAKFS